MFKSGESFRAFLAGGGPSMFAKKSNCLSLILQQKPNPIQLKLSTSQIATTLKYQISDFQAFSHNKRHLVNSLQLTWRGLLFLLSHFPNNRRFIFFQFMPFPFDIMNDHYTFLKCCSTYMYTGRVLAYFRVVHQVRGVVQTTPPKFRVQLPDR